MDKQNNSQQHSNINRSDQNHQFQNDQCDFKQVMNDVNDQLSMNSSLEQNGTFIIHDSVVTESPSRIVSRLDKMIHQNQYSHNYGFGDYDQSIDSVSQFQQNFKSDQNGKGTVIYKDDKSHYHNIINLHQNQQKQSNIQPKLQKESSQSQQDELSYNRSLLKKNNQKNKFFPHLYNKEFNNTQNSQIIGSFISNQNNNKLAQTARLPQLQQMKENFEQNQQRMYSPDENQQQKQIRPYVDHNQTTKIINTTLAMQTNKFQGFTQTDQTRILPISEQSSFYQLMSKPRNLNLDQNNKNMFQIEFEKPRLNLVKQMTHGLLSTYKRIKKKTKKNRMRQSLQNAELLGTIFNKKDLILNQRYKIIKQIGQGVFGLVMQAYDMQNQNQLVAIKILKDSKEFKEQAKREIEILRLINRIDHEKGFIVRYLDTFKYKKRNQCIVFEALEMNLYQLLQQKQELDQQTGKMRMVGLNLEFVKIVAWQILVALSLMSLPNINILHCDLKPENIMLRSANHTGIKLIDFGNACFSHNKLYKYLQSRYYRAPEIIMELPYSTQIDMWSLGCIIYELHFGGDVLFNNSNNIIQNDYQNNNQNISDEKYNKFRQLINIIQVKQEIPPQSMINTSPYKNDLIEMLKLIKIQKTPNFETALQAKILQNPWFKHNYKQNQQEYYRLFNLLSQMLDYNPTTRIRPMDALKHPFFTNKKIKMNEMANYYNDISQIINKQNTNIGKQIETSLSLGDSSSCNLQTMNNFNIQTQENKVLNYDKICNNNNQQYSSSIQVIKLNKIVSPNDNEDDQQQHTTSQRDFRDIQEIQEYDNNDSNFQQIVQEFQYDNIIGKNSKIISKNELVDDDGLINDNDLVSDGISDKDQEEGDDSLDIANEIETINNRHFNNKLPNNIKTNKRILPLNQVSFGIGSFNNNEKLCLNSYNQQHFTYEMNNLKRIKDDGMINSGNDSDSRDLSNINYDKIFEYANQLSNNQQSQNQQSARFGNNSNFNNDYYCKQHVSQMNPQYQQLLNQNKHVQLQQQHNFINTQSSLNDSSTNDNNGMLLCRNTDYSVHVNKDKNQIINFKLHNNNNQQQQQQYQCLDDYNQSSLLLDKSSLRTDTNQSKMKKTYLFQNQTNQQQTKDHFYYGTQNSNQNSNVQQTDSLDEQSVITTDFNNQNLFNNNNKQNQLFPFTYLPPAPIVQQLKQKQQISQYENVQHKNLFMQQIIDDSSLDSSNSDMINDNSGYNFKDDTSMMSNLNKQNTFMNNQQKQQQNLQTENNINSKPSFQYQFQYTNQINANKNQITQQQQQPLNTLQNLLNDTSIISNLNNNNNLNTQQSPSSNNINEERNNVNQGKNISLLQQQNQNNVTTTTNPLNTPNQNNNNTTLYTNNKSPPMIYKQNYFNNNFGNNQQYQQQQQSNFNIYNQHQKKLLEILQTTDNKQQHQNHNIQTNFYMGTQKQFMDLINSPSVQKLRNQQSQEDQSQEYDNDNSNLQGDLTDAIKQKRIHGLIQNINIDYNQQNNNAQYNSQINNNVYGQNNTKLNQQQSIQEQQSIIISELERSLSLLSYEKVLDNDKQESLRDSLVSLQQQEGQIAYISAKEQGLIQQQTIQNQNQKPLHHRLVLEKSPDQIQQNQNNANGVLLSPEHLNINPLLLLSTQQSRENLYQTRFNNYNNTSNFASQTSLHNPQQQQQQNYIDEEQQYQVNNTQMKYQDYMNAKDSQQSQDVYDSDELSQLSASILQSMDQSQFKYESNKYDDILDKDNKQSHQNSQLL